jgi:hypothetical protein
MTTKGKSGAEEDFGPSSSRQAISFPAGSFWPVGSRVVLAHWFETWGPPSISYHLGEPSLGGSKDLQAEQQMSLPGAGANYP